METFAPPRSFTDDPAFGAERKSALAVLDPATIDPPIREIVAVLAGLPCCYTLQSCCGHFVHAAQPGRKNLAPLPAHDVGQVTYRIAYLALCLENSPAGKRLRADLARIPAIDARYVQFGSPGWFWERHPNSYALQVEPARFAHRDEAILAHAEALHVQAVRDRFFARLAELVRAWGSEFGEN